MRLRSVSHTTDATAGVVTSCTRVTCTLKAKKMSKSLKNFISIADFLSSGNTTQRARHFRLYCLLSSYRTRLDIEDTSTALVHAETIEHKVVEFLTMLRPPVAVAKAESAGIGTYASASGVDGGWSLTGPSLKWGPSEVALASKLHATRTAVDVALRCDFDTPAVIRECLSLISSANAYFNAHRNAPEATHSINRPLLANVALFIRTTFQTFGVNFDEVDGLSGVSSSASPSSADDVAAVLDVLGSFRMTVRAAALKELKDAKQLAKSGVAGLAPSTENNRGAAVANSVLRACDELRDKSSEVLGVVFKDTTTGSVWFRNRRS
eukprot:Opistho-2@75007